MRADEYSNVKNIVAYSLLKRIENESEEFFCGGDFQVPRMDVGRYNLWTKVDGTEIYVLSVHFDTRLSPYNFIRIIGMTKGGVSFIISQLKKRRTIFMKFC